MASSEAWAAAPALSPMAITRPFMILTVIMFLVPPWKRYPKPTVYGCLLLPPLTYCRRACEKFTSMSKRLEFLQFCTERQMDRGYKSNGMDAPFPEAASECQSGRAVIDH